DAAVAGDEQARDLALALAEPFDRRGLLLMLDAEDGALRVVEDGVSLDLRDGDDGAGREPRRRRERLLLGARLERLLGGVDDVILDRRDIRVPLDAAVTVRRPDHLLLLSIDDEEGAAHL